MTWVAVVVVVFITAATTITWIYQEEIIRIFISQANKSLKTPVNANRIDLTLWSNFPDLTLQLHDVEVMGSIPGQQLANARMISISLSVWDLIAGNYKVKFFGMQEGRISLLIDEEGVNNYTIINQSRKTTSDSTAIQYELEKIALENIEFSYQDLRSKQQYDIYAEEVEAALQVQNNNYLARVKGPVFSHGFQLDQQVYLSDKSMILDLEIDYDQPGETVYFYPSVIEVNESDFVLEGRYEMQEDLLDLKFRGENSNINTIISLLPAERAENLNAYRSKGEIYFSGVVAGAVKDDNIPLVQIDFGCNHATFYHPEFNKRVVDVSLAGSFTNGEQKNLKTSRLALKKISGEFENRPFRGGLTISNFENYYLDLHFEGIIDINSALKFYPVESIRNASGLIDFNINFKGFANHLKNSKNLDRTVSSGDINLKEVDLDLRDVKVPFKDFNGNFRFKNDDLAISNFNGKIGASDFLLNGFFKDVLAYLFNASEKINIAADLSSTFMDVDELLSGNLTGSKETYEQKYSFNISPKLDLDFNCNIQKIKFRRFRGTNVTGHLNIQRQVAYSKNIAVNAMGGKFSIDGMVDARNQDNLEVLTNSKLENIKIDSLFYVFENFNQSFLEDRHLKGQIFSDLNTYLAFDRNLNLKSEKLSSDISISIVNGQLNDFEPMQSLSKFVEEKSLARLRFSELKNEIKIKDRKIFLPEMKVASNVNQIKVSGTHTFDQLIEYHLMVPLKNYHRRDNDEAFGSIEQDDQGNLNLFLKIVGSTDDYKVVYDTKAVTEKIKKDIKKEGEELKAAFKNKGKEKDRVVELDESEYIEF